MLTTQLPEATQRFLFHDAEKRDPVTARRAQLVRILLRDPNGTCSEPYPSLESGENTE